ERSLLPVRRHSVEQERRSRLLFPDRRTELAVVPDAYRLRACERIRAAEEVLPFRRRPRGAPEEVRRLAGRGHDDPEPGDAVAVGEVVALLRVRGRERERAGERAGGRGPRRTCGRQREQSYRRGEATQSGDHVSLPNQSPERAMPPSTNARPISPAAALSGWSPCGGCFVVLIASFAIASGSFCAAVASC